VRLTAWIAVMLGCVSASAAVAQGFPSRAISVVVPYAAGGALDAVGRIVAGELQQRFRVSVVVDNRAGGGGVIGMTHVSRSSPDGYTLMISSETGQAVLPAIDPNFSIDALNTFTPIGLVGTFPHFIIARRTLGVNTVADLIKLARENPGKLNLGNNGVGTIAHVGIELLKRKANIDITNVPYRGANAAVSDLIAGTVDANIQSLPVIRGQLDNPALKILAILSPERDPRFPDVPTMVEAGFPDLVFVSWTAVFGPPGMQRDVVERISTTLIEAVKTPEAAQRLRNVGFEPIGLGPTELDRFQREVAQRWKAIAQETGIKLQQ
jgi:tripartite-type tricarboxylate transporter receptor subunit TctC